MALNPRLAELQALQAIAKTAKIMGHQIAQGRGQGLIKGTKYRLFGSKLPDDEKPER